MVHISLHDVKYWQKTLSWSVSACLGLSDRNCYCLDSGSQHATHHFYLLGKNASYNHKGFFFFENRIYWIYSSRNNQILKELAFFQWKDSSEYYSCRTTTMENMQCNELVYRFTRQFISLCVGRSVNLHFVRYLCDKKGSTGGRKWSIWYVYKFVLLVFIDTGLWSMNLQTKFPHPAFN